MKRNLVKIIIAIIAIVGVYSLLSHYGVTEYLKRDNIPKIKEKINSFGVIAPLVYIGFLHCCDRFLSALVCLLQCSLASPSDPSGGSSTPLSAQ